MIVKLQRSGMVSHAHICECDSVHISETEDEKNNNIYSVIILHKDNQLVAEWHAGKDGDDHLYIMDNGKTADHIHCMRRPIKKQIRW